MRRYVIKQGDTLWQIAKENNISLEALIAANPHLSDPNYIMPSMVICLPQMPRQQKTPAAIRAEKQAAADKEPCTPCIHTVKEGDTLESIAKHFNIPMEELLLCNRHINAECPLCAGQKIIIPCIEPAKPQISAAEDTDCAEGIRNAKTGGCFCCPCCGKTIYYY